MNYEDIRKARLQHPFRAFKLRMKEGQEYVIAEPETLAITPLNLVFLNGNTGTVVMSSADEVESLAFVDENKKVSA
jgi:hypothetical protein